MQNEQFASNLRRCMLLKATHMDNQKNFSYLMLRVEKIAKSSSGKGSSSSLRRQQSNFFDRKVYYIKLNWEYLYVWLAHIIFWSDFGEKWFEKAIFVGISLANEGFKLYLNGVNYNDVTMETFSLNYTHFYVLNSLPCELLPCAVEIFLWFSLVCVKSVSTSA